MSILTLYLLRSLLYTKVYFIFIQCMQLGNTISITNLNFRYIHKLLYLFFASRGENIYLTNSHFKKIL